MALYDPFKWHDFSGLCLLEDREEESFCTGGWGCFRSQQSVFTLQSINTALYLHILSVQGQ